MAFVSNHDARRPLYFSRFTHQFTNHQVIDQFSLGNGSLNSYSPQIKRPDLTIKPLPELPRGWARICHEVSLFLRSIGLTVIVSTLSGIFNKHFREPSKVAIRRSRATAILRSFIHMIPLGFAILEIALNLQGHYYGREFNRQAFYQIAAKTHEIMAQASLALIVLSHVRHEITMGKGVPFGTFLGSLQFLQVSYLWSPELWSSITAENFAPRRKLITFALLITCGILATTLGPSSATLLIPRTITWSLEPSHFGINGSFQDIWPDYVDDRNVPESCGTIFSGNPYSLCPAGDFRSLYLGILELDASYNVTGLLESGQTIQLLNPLGGSQKSGIGVKCLTDDVSQQCATTVHDIIMEGAWDTISDWETERKFAKSYQDLIHLVSEGYYQPYTSTSCRSDQINAANQKDSLMFPRMLDTSSEQDEEDGLIYPSDITKADVLATLGNTSEFCFNWLDLPPSTSQDRLSGVTILHPVTPNATNINITLCTMGAGWGTSTTSVSSDLDGLFNSQIDRVPKSIPIQNIDSFGEDIFYSTPVYANISGYAYPQRRISLSTTWLNYLNPIVPSLGYNSTAMHILLASTPGFTDGVGIAQILSIVLACGLARSGVTLGWQGKKNIIKRNGTRSSECSYTRQHHCQIQRLATTA